MSPENSGGSLGCSLKACASRARALASNFIKWLNGIPTEEPAFDPDRISAVNRNDAGRSSRGSVAEPTRLTNAWKKYFGRGNKSQYDSAEKLDSCGKSRIFQVPLNCGQYYGINDNAIKTAKYSLITFIPKNLYEQFHRVANFYFLVIIILQFIPAISNVSPWIAMLPLAFVVIVTAIKDGLEDWKRHKSDNKVNYSTAKVLRRAHSPTTPIEYAHAPKGVQTSRFMWWKREAFRLRQAVFGFGSISTEPDNGEINRWKSKYWKDIAVGDLVFIRDGDSLPADVLIISTSESDGKCFVETMNLDGETNLKIKYSLPETQWVQSVDDAVGLQMLVETELPSSNMHSFNGKIVIPRYDCVQPREDVIGVSLNEVLLRGCTLRNTGWVVGCVIYTGTSTKLMLNTGVTPSKRSRIERQMNPQIVLCFVLLFVICVACAIVQSSLVSSNRMTSAPYWYSSFGSKVYGSAAFTGFLTFWSSMVLFQTLVPISLYITVEICKTIQAYFIHEDIEMYDHRTGTKCIPRAWNISDDLGQIEYVFSDKTGTLTRNIMEFRMLSVGGTMFGSLPQNHTTEEWERRELQMHEKLMTLCPEFRPPIQPSFVDPALADCLLAGGKKGKQIVETLTLMALCHTVLCEDICEGTGAGKTQTAVEYKAQSPDEAALVKTARDLGVAFAGRHQGNQMMLNLFGRTKQYILLNVVEFTSERKRMSVIVRDMETNAITLYCKGADSIILNRLDPDDGETQRSIEAVLVDLERFASAGMRTLCLAKKEIDEAEYKQWLQRYNHASAAINDRELLMSNEADAIEQSLQLLGATAIEDRLQEGVPECIETIQEAGIKIWVLTGDKLETAINIAYSSRLLGTKSVLLVINGSDFEAVKDQLMSAGKEREQETPGDCVMIIEGHSLRFALQHALRKTFLALACQCRAVVCCRTSPLQKAKVVELVRKSQNAMTLAIGDGANDVSMLQEADVGVGVAGEEGMQAVMASDYAIGQFRHLVRLLLLHGRWSYHRSAKVTLCSFHKNIAFVVSAFWYQWNCAFTSSYIYDYMYANFFNILLTMPPILVLGCLDQDVSEGMAMALPQLYRRGIAHGSYSLTLFVLYTANGLWQSAACFYVPRLAYSRAVVDAAGHPESRTFLGNAVGLSVIVAVNWFVLGNTKSWNIVAAAAFVATLLSLAGLMVVCSFIDRMTLFGSVWQLAEPRFYAALVLSVAIAVTPQVLYKLGQSMLWPNDLDIVREAEKMGLMEARKTRPKSRLVKRISSVADRIKRRMLVVNIGSRRRERHTGYAFSQQDGGTASIVLPC